MVSMVFRRDTLRRFLCALVSADSADSAGLPAWKLKPIDGSARAAALLPTNALLLLLPSPSCCCPLPALLPSC